MPCKEVDTRRHSQKKGSNSQTLAPDPPEEVDKRRHSHKEGSDSQMLAPDPPEVLTGQVSISVPFLIKHIKHHD
jgi:hypothetical protein